MKFDTNLRLLFSAFLLVLLASTFYPTNSIALEPSVTVDPKNPACVKSAAGIITRPDAEKNCELTPDQQKLTFLRIDLCTEKPTGPTVSVPIDRSKCTTFLFKMHYYTALLNRNTIIYRFFKLNFSIVLHYYI